MLYRETESVGEVYIEKEYEGTPQEIAELMMKQPEKLKLTDGNGGFNAISESVEFNHTIGKPIG